MADTENMPTDEEKTDYEAKYDAPPPSDPSTPTREGKYSGGSDMNTEDQIVPVATSFGFSRVVNPPGSYGGKTMSLEHAESPHSRVSKRYDAITDGAEKLENDQTFLRAQAIAKNRAFIVRIEALHERIGRWEVRVKAETEAREREDAQIRVALASKLTDLEERFMRRLLAEERKIEVDEVPGVHRRYDLWYEDFREFVDVTVPDVIEMQQGQVTRHLKKARESFEIDNTKLLQREQDIRDNFAAHVKEAVRMQEQETKTRTRDQLLLEEVINERTRVWDRCEEDFYAPYMTQITEMKGAMEEEVVVRAENDMVVLETMKESMDRLQAVVLQNFGRSANNGKGRRK
jgi:hypothetical protein